MPGAAPTIAELRAGDEVSGVYAVTRKDRLTARTGTPYLALELRDRSGTLSARAFREADALASRFERGDLLRVAGRVERFRDQLALELHGVQRVEPGSEPGAEPERFLPVAYRDLDELEGFLEHLAREVVAQDLRALLESLLADAQLRAQWRRAPCTRGAHHAYLGGLLEHTVAVGTLVLELAPLHPRLDRDLLLCAALVHDLGRTREYTYGAEIGLTSDGRLLGHIQLGVGLLAEPMTRAGIGAQRRAALLHCVLGHHGGEALPGRRFGTAEALALYRLNALDAGVKGALEQGLG